MTEIIELMKWGFYSPEDFKNKEIIRIYSGYGDGKIQVREGKVIDRCFLKGNGLENSIKLKVKKRGEVSIWGEFNKPDLEESSYISSYNYPRIGLVEYFDGIFWEIIKPNKQ